MEKNREYYEALDKRTNEFKEWKKSQTIEPNSTADLQNFTDEFIAKATQEKLNEKHAANPTVETGGLGDTVAKITKATGIKALVELFTPEGKDCGCDDRQEKLNKYPVLKNKRSVECLTLAEYEFLSSKLGNRQPINGKDVLKLKEIHSRVFNQKSTATCSSCSLKYVQSELLAVLNRYK